jgi:hypothetical protein
MTVFAVDFHSDARIELATIAHRYEELAVDLGVEFLLSIDATLKRIQRYPLLYAATWNHSAERLFPDFPSAWSIRSAAMPFASSLSIHSVRIPTISRIS